MTFKEFIVDVLEIQQKQKSPSELVVPQKPQKIVLMMPFSCHDDDDDERRGTTTMINKMLHIFQVSFTTYETLCVKYSLLF